VTPPGRQDCKASWAWSQSPGGRRKGTIVNREKAQNGDSTNVIRNRGMKASNSYKRSHFLSGFSFWGVCSRKSPTYVQRAFQNFAGRVAREGVSGGVTRPLELCLRAVKGTLGLRTCTSWGSTSHPKKKGGCRLFVLLRVKKERFCGRVDKVGDGGKHGPGCRMGYRSTGRMRGKKRSDPTRQQHE